MGREREPLEHKDRDSLVASGDSVRKQLDGFDAPPVPPTTSLAGSEQAASEPPPDSDD